MSKKHNPFAASFITPLGAHRSKTLANDLNVKKHLKDMNSSPDVNPEKFNKNHRFMSNLQKISEGLRTINRMTGGVVGNADNSLLNLGASLVSYLTQSNSQPLGKNDAIYHKTHTHIGRPTSSKIHKLGEGPEIESVTKNFKDSSMDYLTHGKRKLLNITNGFNEKSFNFLGEDTFFTLNDFYKLLRVEKFKKELENPNGIKDIFGCIKKSHFQIKIKNKLDSYSAHISIHLIKIKNVETDVRTLLDEITHNPTMKTQDSIGRLPKDFQYSDPITTNMNNKCCISFTTDLRCRLTQSTKFRELATVVRTWNRTLPPASIWDFNLTTHFGRGLHLNTIYDKFQKSNFGSNNDSQTFNISLKDISFNKISEVIEEYRNNKKIRIDSEKVKKILEEAGEAVNVPKKTIQALHPVNYIVCLEVVGDRRGTIKRQADNDLFNGYSPVMLNFEFCKLMTFLTNQTEEKVLVYKTTMQERNFSEDSDFSEIFNADRQPKFHVNFDEILFPGKNKTKKQYPYAVEYDQVILNNSDNKSIVDDLANLFEKIGFNKNEATEDDGNLNFEMKEEEEITPPPRPESEENNDNNLRGDNK